MPQMVKIVITGGPCAGKTTALSRIREHFSDLGYRVVIIGETATEMITGGVAPWIGRSFDFQLALLRLQLFKEQVYTEWAKDLGDNTWAEGLGDTDWVEDLKADKLLLVCDRGAMDGKAYLTENEFAAMLTALGLDEKELRNSYDAVFHLVTAAKGAEESYALTNNQARIETIPQAIDLDDKLIAAWSGHPHFRTIGTFNSVEKKIDCLISEIDAFLGEL